MISAHNHNKPNVTQMARKWCVRRYDKQIENWHGISSTDLFPELRGVHKAFVSLQFYSSCRTSVSINSNGPLTSGNWVLILTPINKSFLYISRTFADVQEDGNSQTYSMSIAYLIFHLLEQKNIKSAAHFETTINYIVDTVEELIPDRTPRQVLF